MGGEQTPDDMERGLIRGGFAGIVRLHKHGAWAAPHHWIRTRHGQHP
jgi:hypothetical protein